MTIWQLGVVSITLISCLFGAFAGYMTAKRMSLWPISLACTAIVALSLAMIWERATIDFLSTESVIYIHREKVVPVPEWVERLAHWYADKE